MKTINLLSVLIAVSFLASCTNSENANNQNTNIAQAADYEQYLSPDENPKAEEALKELDFWTKKYQASPTQYPYLSKIAGAQSSLFEYTGDITYLNDSYKNLKEVTAQTNSNQAGALRALARNCISQHKFREAYGALEKAEAIGDQKFDTQKMMFDVCMELGNKEKAKEYLDILKEKPGFDYNIRLAKWNDHEGDLDGAITLMESALEEATAEKNEGLILWSATNLGDFYGHAGRIQDSYNQYLKALSIDKNNSYALKGISWIAFSHDKNVDEAKRILTALKTQRPVPDYDLRLAEIAEYEKDEKSEKLFVSSFRKKIKDERYGDMYNTYEADIVDLDRTFAIANTEVANRPTPQSYALLAWAHYKNKDNQKALEIIEQHVADQTFEPAAQYKMAVIYKSNNLNERVHELKADLEGSFYELGPLMGRKIGSL